MGSQVARFEFIAQYGGHDTVRRSPWHDERDRVQIIRAGHYHCERAGQALHAGEGDVVYTPAHCAIVEWSDPTPRYHCLNLVFRWPDRLWAEPFIVPDPHGLLRLAAHRLIRLQEEHDEALKPALDYILQGVLGELVVLTATPEDALVRRVRGYIVDHLAERIRLDDLAAVADLSRFHFSRTYRQLTGLTPIADVRRLRMAAAYNLTMHSDLPLKSIADATGMANVPHLSNVFRETFGISISELRRIHRIGKTPRKR